MLQRRLHHVEQSPQTERYVLDRPADEETRRSVHAAVASALHVLANALQVDVIVHFSGIARSVEAQAIRVVLQVLELEMTLVLEQQVVHLPELTLPGGGFGRFRRRKRVRVNFLEREVTEHEAHLACEALEEQLDGWRGLLAVRALEVTVFDDRERRVRRTEEMVDGADGNREVKCSLMVHLGITMSEALDDDSEVIVCGKRVT